MTWWWVLEGYTSNHIARVGDETEMREDEVPGSHERPLVLPESSQLDHIQSMNISGKLIITLYKELPNSLIF